jgi:hypothetical protein
MSVRKMATAPARNSRNKSISRINQRFDDWELVVERSDRLLSKSKPALVNLFVFLHLLIDLVVVLAVLWKAG